MEPAHYAGLLRPGAPTVPVLHPNMAHVYWRKVRALATALEREQDRDGARQAIRGFLERIVFPPDGLLRIEANFPAMLAAGQGRPLSFEDPCGKSGCGGGI
jgi:hypothetical protein